MSPREPVPCTHDRGAGTTVCFRCRYEQGIAQRARLRRMASWGAIGVIVVASVAAAGNTSAVALFALGKGKSSAEPKRSTTDKIIEAHGARAETLQVVQLASMASAPATAPAASVAAGPSPSIEEGVSTLKGGLEAVRHGDTVVVSFDTPDARTRRADKFERLLRQTLPQVYGRFADSLLTAHPTRLVTDPAALVNELPKGGLTVGASGGWRLVVWPETRPGQDGPLVVRYRATLAR